MEWPKYRAEMLIKGNPESQVGIVTLYTQKERILEYLSPSDFALLGHLYNPTFGVSILIRNCLANKNIRYIVVCGQDLSKSGESLVKLSQNGVDSIEEDGNIVGHKVKGLSEERIIEKELPIEAINLFRENVKVLDYRNLKEMSELKKITSGLEKLPAYGEPEFYPEAEIKTDRFPSDHSVFKIKGRLVGEIWLRMLDQIMRFGAIKKSEYSEDQKEILNLIAVVTEEDPGKVDWQDYFQFSRQHLEEYIPKVTTAKHVEGVHYTYGSRFKNWRGINQIDSVVAKLKKSLYSRRAIAITWDVEKDNEHPDCPCIDLIQCLVQDKKLFMTVFIRSNDIFEAWPENAIALRTLQFEIAEAVGIAPGSLTTISGSAHVYERNWTKSLDLLKKHPLRAKRLGDDRGNFVISLSEGKIKVEHQAPDGAILEVMEATTAEEIHLELVNKQKVSDLYHAFYIAKELQKAELALQLGLAYEQEAALDWDSLKKSPVPQKGQFIVIDGLDGSGKGTQTDLLVKRLKKEGHQVQIADFPQYGNWSAGFVERYLRGEFGGAKDVKAKQASLFYALDRYAAHFQIKQWLEQGITVIANRYVSANKGHQLGKLASSEERLEFLKWINETEYGVLGVPVPDLTLFLHMLPEIGQKLVDKKVERTYTRGEKRDLHEKDLGHLQDAEAAYLFCLEHDGMERWKRIVCFAGDQPRTVDEIHDDLYGVVKELL